MTGPASMSFRWPWAAFGRLGPLVMNGAVRGLTAASLAMTLAAPSRAADQLSEQQATRKAVALLRGDVYGDQLMQILGHIKKTELIDHGSTDCGGVIASPVWAFHVQARLGQSPVDGWLYLDARTGEKTCASLPFMR